MEADVLRWSLLIIGSLVIVGLAVHGIWLSRKNSEKKANASRHNKDQEYQPSGWQHDADAFDEALNDTNDGIIDDPDIKFDFGIDEISADVAHETSIKNEFDDLGLGAVRVVSSSPIEDAEPMLTTRTQAEPESTSSKIYASVVTQPKPEYAAKYSSLAAETVAISKQERATSSKSNAAQKSIPQRSTGATNKSISSNESYQAPEPPPFLLKKKVSEPEGISDPVVEAQEKLHSTLAEKLSVSEQVRHSVKRKKADLVKKNHQSKIGDDQMRIDFDDQPIVKLDIKLDVKEELKTKSVKPSSPEQQQEVLVLNVKPASNNPILGSALLPMLLTLGFKFGDQDIFHRHVNSNGKGPVLFSLANMFKPGDFDIDNLENFTTGGVLLFMILPIEGEPHQVFNMMHNAARKIAEEFSAQIYDGRRTLLTKQSLQQYVEKIREFERQRLLRGS
jgi:cell division protein ZipA